MEDSARVWRQGCGGGRGVEEAHRDRQDTSSRRPSMKGELKVEVTSSCPTTALAQLFLATQSFKNFSLLHTKT